MAYQTSIIALAFVKKSIDDGNPITQMKLQKLVYFAHGIHLALDRGALVKEVFQAWEFGPVIPAIYQEYKLYGRIPITSTDYLEGVEKKNHIVEKLDAEARDSIDVTWQNLKYIDALKLSRWTHMEGSPWKESYRDNVTDIVIPNEKIKAYFTKKFVVTK